MIEFLFLLAFAFSAAVICRWLIPLGHAVPVPGGGLYRFSADAPGDHGGLLRGCSNDRCVSAVGQTKLLSANRLTGFSSNPTDERLSARPVSC